MLFLDSPTISMQRESEMFVVSQHNEKKYSASTEPICCGFSYWNFRLTHTHSYRNAHIFGILSLSRERELVLTNGIRILVWASSFNQICKASVCIIGLLVLKFLVETTNSSILRLRTFWLSSFDMKSHRKPIKY